MRLLLHCVRGFQDSEFIHGSARRSKAFLTGLVLGTTHNGVDFSNIVSSLTFHMKLHRIQDTSSLRDLNHTTLFLENGSQQALVSQ